MSDKTGKNLLTLLLRDFFLIPVKFVDTLENNVENTCLLMIWGAFFGVNENQK